MILNVHDTFPELFATKFGLGLEGDRLVFACSKSEERLSAKLANHVIVVTDQARRRLESRGVGGVGHTTVVMNSPDEQVFGPPRAPLELPAEGPVRVLYHGGLADRFGVETLIRAMSRLKTWSLKHSSRGVGRWSLRICGSGEDRDRLAALAAQIDYSASTRRQRACALHEHLELAAGLLHRRGADVAAHFFTELLLPVKLLEQRAHGPARARLTAARHRRLLLRKRICAYSDRRRVSEDPSQPAIEAVCADPVAAGRRARERDRGLGSDRLETASATRYLVLVDKLTGASHCASPAVFDTPALAVSS